MFAGPGLSFVRAADETVYSGPQPGERLISYQVQGVYGKLKGRTLDFVEMAGDKPFLFVFVDHTTRPSADLNLALMHYGQMRIKDGLFPATTYLTGDINRPFGIDPPAAFDLLTRMGGFPELVPVLEKRASRDPIVQAACRRAIKRQRRENTDE